MTLYKKNIGQIGEQKAIAYLKTQDFSIIKKNFHSRFGEIDIVAKKNDTIYFVEVKTRTNLNKGQPWEAVNKNKIHRIKKTAEYFLLKYRFEKYKLKLAIISILIDKNKEIIKFFENII